MSALVANRREVGNNTVERPSLLIVNLLRLDYQRIESPLGRS